MSFQPSIASIEKSNYPRTAAGNLRQGTETVVSVAALGGPSRKPDEIVAPNEVDAISVERTIGRLALHHERCTCACRQQEREALHGAPVTLTCVRLFAGSCVY